MSKNKKDNSNKNLGFENEIKKLKLSAEHGAQFSSSENSDLPQEVESQWLNNIMAFEEASKNPKTTRIGDLLDKKHFPPVSELNDAQITIQLEDITKRLNDKSIQLDAAHEVPERELYRFITEEFLDKEIDLVNVPGMVSHFIYEEYHPNHSEDLKRYTAEFIDMLFRKDLEFIQHTFSGKMLYKGEEISDEGFVGILETLISEFNLKLDHYEVKSIKIDSDHASVTAKMDYHQNDTRIDELCHFNFKFQYDFWYLENIKMPGLRMW